MAPVTKRVLHQVAKRFLSTLQTLGEFLTRQTRCGGRTLQITIFHSPVERDVIDVIGKGIVSLLVDQTLLIGNIKHRLVEFVQVFPDALVHLKTRLTADLSFG